MKLTKALALVLCVVMLLGTVSVFAVTSSAETLAKLDGKYTVEDGKITLKLKLQNNPGINTMIVDLGYDSTLLTLDSITNGDVFCEANNGSMFEINEELNPLILYFDENGIGNITANGTVATIVFTIVKESDDYGFTLDVEEENTFGCGEDVTPVDVLFGECTVKEAPDVTPADINNDGKVNSVDANLIKQIIAGAYDPTDDEFAAADINGDGKVNAVDSNMLKQILIGED